MLNPALTTPLVLHVRVVTGVGGGPEKTILNSPRFYGPLGYLSHLAYLHPPGDPGFEALRERGRALQAEVISVPDRGPFDLSVLWRLIRLCREQRVAIWHGHDYKSDLFGLLARPFHRMKLVTTLHGFGVLTGRMPLYNRIDKACLKFYEAIFCVSNDLHSACLADRLPPDRCHLVPNGIDTEDYRRQHSTAEAKRALGWNPNEMILGAVGRLSDEKAFDLLIRATVELRKSGKPVALVIAGEGDERAKLEALIAELNCGAYVRLLGYMADAKPLYEAFDFYVLSSLREGLPNVVLEAMAMETPVVATRVGGVATLIEQGISGILVEPNSVAELIAGITRVWDQPNLAGAIRQAARERIETHFSFAQRMAKITQVYDQLLSRK